MLYRMKCSSTLYRMTCLSDQQIVVVKLNVNVMTQVHVVTHIVTKVRVVTLVIGDRLGINDLKS